jgi:hypothetical protein
LPVALNEEAGSSAGFFFISSGRLFRFALILLKTQNRIFTLFFAG